MRKLSPIMEIIRANIPVETPRWGVSSQHRLNLDSLVKTRFEEVPAI